MNILGVDPGTRIMGWGHVVYERGKFVSFNCGTIRPSRTLDLRRKLTVIHDELRQVIVNFDPDVIAMEAGFVGKYASAIMVTAYARSVVMLASHGREFVDYTPAEIKKAAATHGGASKDEVARMVAAILGMPNAVFQEDQADALAAAICHASRLDEAALIGAAQDVF